MKNVVKVAHWFPIDEGKVVRVFGTHKAPHSLLNFVMDMILSQEVCYQIT